MGVAGKEGWMTSLSGRRINGGRTATDDDSPDFFFQQYIRQVVVIDDVTKCNLCWFFVIQVEHHLQLLEEAVFSCMLIPCCFTRAYPPFQ